MKKILTPNQETILQSLSSVPSLVNGLWEDLRLFTSHRALGQHATIEQYMTKHPANNGESSESNNGSKDDSGTNSSSDDDSSESDNPNFKPRRNSDDGTPGNNSIVESVEEHHRKIKELVATSDNIKSSFRITTDDDLTPADDNKIKYLIFSVPDISVLHHVWSTKQTEQ